MSFILRHKWLYYLIQFTWNLPMNIIGLIVAFFLILFDVYPKRYKNAIYFEIGENWGGLELGTFFVVNKNPSDHLLCHEYGHCIDGLIKGPYMMINGLISAGRYWYREIFRNYETMYDDLNLERRASFFGHKDKGDNITANIYMKSGEIIICDLTAVFGKGKEPIAKKKVYKILKIKSGDVKYFRLKYN